MGQINDYMCFYKAIAFFFFFFVVDFCSKMLFFVENLTSFFIIFTFKLFQNFKKILTSLDDPNSFKKHIINIFSQTLEKWNIVKWQILMVFFVIPIIDHAFT